MVRAFNRNSTHDVGELIVEQVDSDSIDVFYEPPTEKLTLSKLNAAKAYEYRVKLLHVNSKDRCIVIYPLNTLSGHEKFLKPKYEQIERITLANVECSMYVNTHDISDLFEEFPSGFVKNYDYGLGLLKEYRFLVSAIEEISNCNEIVIDETAVTGISKDDSAKFTISFKDFDSARRSMDRISDRTREAGRAVKTATVFNLLAPFVGAEEKTIQLGSHPVTKLAARFAHSDDFLGPDDQDVILNVLLKNNRSIAETKPETLIKLQNDIELVTLEVLIQRYEVMMGQKLKEGQWQAFFNANPFVLSLAFGYPIIMVEEQASVGGRKLSGTGEKITDFLAKNSMTNNTALFEIKTPHTLLLSKNPYRKGIFTPSRDLSGAINQALDQKYQFQKQVAQIKEASRIHDIESYSVHSCLIIGKMPDDVEQQKSFELFRRNSKDVQIVTFDELLGKLRQLYGFLNANTEKLQDADLA